ncbi:MAG TPA: hypothetical protein PK199_01920 [Bacteroidales bacterium]|nr:hypothetical protein [Bacteroidales bacterium]
MRQITTVAILFFTFFSVLAQEKTFKQQALEQFKQEKYPLAISLMEQALQENPKDAEVYYYLGFFTHYNAYDSKPLRGYNSEYSQKVLDYFDKALELQPNYGDAKYFYLAECSAHAIKAFQEGKVNEVKGNFEKAFEKGVIPEWGIEFGKNILNSCEKDAILFTHGDFAFNMCMFVQLHYNYRNDVSVVPLALLDRPSFDIVLQQQKDSDYLRGVDLGITKEQILDMHPYKWDTTTVHIPITPQVMKEFSLPKNYTMDWVITPDLHSERQVSRIPGAPIKKQAYLSPTRAMLLAVVETNAWNRPIYFTNNFEYYFLAGLQEYFQDCGLVSKLTPLKTDNTSFQMQVSAFEKLVLHTDLKNFKDIIANNQPRISWNIRMYDEAYLTLAQHYQSQGTQDKISQIIDCYKQNLHIGFDAEHEKYMISKLEEMKK